LQLQRHTVCALARPAFPRFSNELGPIDDLTNKPTDTLFRAVWRAKLNGNLSRFGVFKYRKTYWHELSVNYVLDATLLTCPATQKPTKPWGGAQVRFLNAPFVVKGADSPPRLGTQPVAN
jgi:hypothetical protein